MSLAYTGTFLSSNRYCHFLSAREMYKILQTRLPRRELKRGEVTRYIGQIK